MKRVLALALVAMTAYLAMADVSFGASRRVPFGFFGVVMNSDLFTSSPSVIDSEMARMAKAGVESVRTNVNWQATESSPGVYDWSAIDTVVGMAAKHGLLLLPIVEFTPRWASSHPSSAWTEYAPSDPATFAGFMTQLVRRYGPHGSYWLDHPAVPRVPIRTWQIWNEPEGTKYDWRSVPWPSTYTALLKAAYAAVHAADHRAIVVSGAVVGLNTTNLTPWAEARSLYRAGAKRYFDVLAVNAFTNDPASVANSVSRSVDIVDRVRQVMRHNGDARKPIWVTEVTWTAALGRIPKNKYAGFETTAKGQAKRLAAYYTRIASSRPAGIQRVVWYAWTTSYTPVGSDATFEYSGLVMWRPGQQFTPLPILSTYARTAVRFEGCRKSANATRCG
jgi:hypothetical protein